MPRRRLHPMYAAAVVERSDGHVLIALPTPDDLSESPQSEPTRFWQFPRGEVREHESAEAAMRRIAREGLGIEVDIEVGQPPLRFEQNGRTIEVRYFFCGLVGGEARPAAFAEVRWVLRGQLREYEFDPITRPVVDWMLEEDAE